MLHFCTYFDANYLSRFLPMYRSLARFCEEDCRLWALCLDHASEIALSKLQLPSVIPVPLSELEAHDQDLLGVKGGRSRIEYYFTCTPALICYLFKTHFEIGLLTYLDADLHFYSSLRPIWNEMGDAAILIIPHRFPERLIGQERHGIFNVAFLSFRRDERAQACIESWRRRCLEWCYDRYEEGKFGDQKYLDDWPGLFPGVHVLQHKGADLAPWNIEQYRVTREGDGTYVDGYPLIFYHFQGYQRLSRWAADPGIYAYGQRCPKTAVLNIHVPYVKAVMEAERLLGDKFSLAACGSGSGRDRKDTDYAGAGPLWRVHYFLEGRVIVWLLGRVWYCDFPWLRKLLGLYDRLRSKGRREPFVRARDVPVRPRSWSE